MRSVATDEASAPITAERSFTDHLDRLADAMTATRASCATAVALAAALVADTLRRDGAVLACGNGGSAAQAQHFVAELVGRMTADRLPLRAMSLTADSSTLTALGNDYGYDRVFARQVQAQGRPADTLVAFSVSGTSPNVLIAIETARLAGLNTVLVTGQAPAPNDADVVIAVPSPVTAHVQEIHLAVTHALSSAVERELFPELA